MVIVFGDTQSTLFLERLAGREDNPRERSRLLREIADRRARIYISLGDLVAFPSAKNWRNLDPFFGEVRANGAAAFAAPGNHDLWPLPSLGYANLRDRGLIPLSTQWQKVDAGGVRFFLLDSNPFALGSRFHTQTRWLEREVELAHHDRNVRSLVFVTHHPPWTNSTVTGDNDVMLQAIVRVFRSCRKRATWLSGHAHAYERFTDQGRTLVVAGSSGAPRVRLKQGGEVRHTDVVKLGSPSPFGWLELEGHDSQAPSMVWRGFTTLTSKVETYDRFDL